MNKLFAKLLICCCLPLLWASSTLGQTNNISSFVVSESHEEGVINLATLTPSINITLLAKGQGALPGSIILEAPQSCRFVKEGTPPVNATACGNLYDTTNHSEYLLSHLNFMDNPLMNVGTDASGITVSNCTTYTINHLIGEDTVSSWSIPTTTLSYPSTCGTNSATVTTNDGSGITATLTAGAPFSVSATSVSNAAGWTENSSGFVQDPFGNEVSYQATPYGFVDTLGAVTTLTDVYGGDFPYGYTDAAGNSQSITSTNGTATTFQNSSCGTGWNGTSVTPISSINFPDSTKISLTWDTNGTGIDGLIKSITLRTGGTITYTYGTQNCGNASPFYFSTLSRATVDGTTTYTVGTWSGGTMTTVLDPGQNKVVYQFYGSLTAANTPLFTQSVTRYQNTGTVASPAYAEISSKTYCYNTSCTAAPSLPITTLEIKSYLGSGPTFMSDETQTFDSTYGLLLTDATTDEITSQTITKTIVYGTDSSGTCVAITNTNIHDHPCTITTKNGTTWLSESTYTYNANGALTSSSACLSSTCTGSSALTTTYTPNTSPANGTYTAIQGPNGQTVNYTYGSCNSLMPTDVTTTVNSVAIDNKATWNCNAGVVTDTTDPNGNEDDTTYDSMNRIHTYNDRTGDTNTTTYTYGTPTLDHVETVDPLSVTKYQYTDSLGRPSNSQVYNGTNYDTITTTRGWKDSMNNSLTNFQTTVDIPCTTTLGATCSTGAKTTLTNPIAGVVSTSDTNSGTGTYAINGRDTSYTAGPAPSGENTKVVQTEVDGFGRNSSTCALTSSGYNGRVACGQTMGGNGTLTSNTYSFPSAGVSETQTTRGSQTHTTKTDALGRVTSVQTPEAGTVTKVYDSIGSSTCGAASNSAGDLVQTTDAASQTICMYYDGLHRLTKVQNSNQSVTNPVRRFAYDSTSGGTPPTGYPSTGANIIGRLMEAETDFNVVLTDEWFAYDAMGRMTDMWEKTPNSGSTYYHTTVTYNADGTPTGLTAPTFSAIAWGVDTEDRWNSMTYGASTTIVSATAGNGFTYDAAGHPTNVPVGSGGNQDVFTYDGLGNMTEYTFNIGTKADDGKLTWNSIGSLGKLVINDTVTGSTDSQTCVYAYDDVARLLSASTVTGSTCNGPMTYGYDQYDNMWQSGSFSNGCSTCYSSTNNQQTGTPTLTYDSNGNVTYDQTNTYTWDIYGRLASAVAGSTAATCGTSGMCYVYDATGNLVEEQFNGSNSQYVFSPIGRVAKMNGQTGTWELVSAPGGGKFWRSSGTNKFIHTDWIGSGRLVYPVGSGSVYNDQAYEPYGQPYNVSGTSLNLFAGDFQDDSGLGLYLTPNRNLPQVSARWLSADPAHASWNAYSYPTDPNRQTDPSGLEPFFWGLGWDSASNGWNFVKRQANNSNFLSTGYNTEDVAYPPGYVPGSSYIENQIDECPQCFLMASAFFKFSSKMTPEDVEFNTSQIPFAKDELENLINQRSNQEQLIRDLRDSYNRTKDIMTDAQRINAYTEQYEANAEAMRLSAAINDLDADIARAERGFGGAGSGTINGLMPFLFLEGGLLNPTNTGRDDRSVPHFWGPGDNTGSWVAPIQTPAYINSVLQNINNQQIHWPQ